MEIQKDDAAGGKGACSSQTALIVPGMMPMHIPSYINADIT